MEEVGLLGQTRLLLWKNWLLKKRHLASTLSEVLVPLAYVCLVVWLQTKDPDVEIPEEVYTCPRRSSISPTLLFPEDPEIDKEFVLELSTKGFGPGLMTVPPFTYLLLVASKIQHVFALVPGQPNNSEQIAWLESFRDMLDEWSRELSGEGWQKLSKISQSVFGFSFCRFGSMAKMFSSQEELNKYVKSDDYGTGIWPENSGCPDDATMEKPKLHLALVLEEIGDSTKGWSYKIQTNMSVIPFTYPKIGFTERIRTDVKELYMDQYMMSGFLTMQQTVDRYLINHTVSSSREVEQVALRQVCDTMEPLLPELENIVPFPIPKEILDNIDCPELLREFMEVTGLHMDPLTKPVSYLPNDVRMAQFPTPKHISRPFYLKIKDVFGLDLVLTFLWPISRLIRGIVHEKETRVREGMRMMGLRYAALYWSWFITYACIFTITSTCITAITHVSLFSASAPELVFMYFFLFGLSVISYCFMISVLFSRAKTAATAGVVLFFMGFFGYFGVMSRNAGAAPKTFGCLLAPTAFGIGASILASYEAGGMGVQWQNAFSSPNDQEIPFIQVLISLVLDTFIYLCLTFYLDNVIPQEFGVPKPYYFLCTRRFWFGKHNNSFQETEMTDSNDDVELGSGSEFIEGLAAEQRRLVREGRCVRLRNLTKIFNKGTSNEKIAVDNLNLTMLEGEILVLLGHNGAGKTTVASMLAGLIPKTSGSASLYGMEIGSDMDEIRKSLGVCPQHNVLFPELTVEEHLRFFAHLKCVEGVQEAVEGQIARIGLTEKRYVRAGNLSGGQQRKLSVAIALIGDSKVVFLDEPTSGMDAYSRRSTWNMLQDNRAGRVMILTTHFMDEADLLGDRIAIMAESQLKCCGTSLFLKSKFGTGYTLSFATESAQVGRVIDQDANREKLGQLISSRIQDAKVFSSVGSEVAVKAPFSAAKDFPALFDHLDRNKTELNLESYGVSVTTLEEVFIRVASNTYEKDAVAERPNMYRRLSNDGLDFDAFEDATMEGIGSVKKFSLQFRALFAKRFQYAKRDRKSVCCNVVLPILLLVLGLGLLKAFPLKTEPPLILDLAQFKQGSENFIPVNYTSQTAPVQFDSEAQAVLATIPVGLNYSCVADPNPQKIPDGEHIRGLSEWLLEHQHRNKSSLYGAMQFGNSESVDSVLSATLLVNSTAKHGPGIFLNQLDQAVARWKNVSWSDGKIIVVSHPFPFTSKFVDLLDSFSSVSAAISIIIAFSFVPASVAIFVVKEREIRAKHQQLISGASIAAYWCSSFAWDVCMYTVPWSLSVLCVHLFQISAFEGENIIAVTVLFLFYGLSVIPFTYVLSFLFESHSTAQNLVLLVNYMTGLILLIVSFVMSFIETTMETNRVLKYLYRIFPGFCLGNGLLGLTVNYSIKEFLPQEMNRSPFSWDVLGAELAYLAASSIGYFALTLVIDYALSYPWFRSRVNSLCIFNMRKRNFSDSLKAPLLDEEDKDAEGIEDDDVLAERNRVDDEYETSEDVIILRHLRKEYTDGKVAVNGLSFGVPSGEIFGFLGLNGAGKTSTLRCLTGDLLPTSGSAKLVGKDILQQQGDLRMQIGYCPQFDALLEHLTVREHLELFARIKCIPEANVARVAETKMSQLNLTEYRDKPAGQLSGGNRRKLSVAIAMVGSPPLIFADEPTTGMDAYNKRFLLDVIAGIPLGRHGSRKGTVVLTSHSLEECEALCTKVGIMVSGQFQCYGSVQRLKSRFGKGLMINVKLGTGDSKRYEEFLRRLPPNLEMKDIEQSCADLGNRERCNCIAPGNIAGGVVWTAIEKNGSVDAAFFADWFLSENMHEALGNFLRSKLSAAICVERRGHHSRWRIPETIIPLGKIFYLLEEAKDAVSITEYALSTATLEQIFLGFAAKQNEETAAVQGLS